ncbi:nuclear transport factor 2 family protein [Pseudoxanthomonas sp. Root630]|uniref:nuclear transport factor 2 family protein n=1 Tax=Pseudoxanthomonas sp. Root630 TaxID=1736574 RepID=UPI000AD5A3A5|nr:nuclear transport factor 2 family protein [Pseudoxanthomonas sp. Root630]
MYTRLLLMLASLLPCAAAAHACSVVPDTMRAARIHAPGGPEALRVERVPTPTLGAGDVLVRVHYASINPVDWKLQEAGRLPFPATPGGDFAGEVVAVAPGVTTFACGDRVAGIVDPRERSGSYAEYVAAPVAALVPAPPAFTLQEAAAYPTVAVAAWRYLVGAADVRPGERVLVHGGAGGVGSMVVQLAKARGAQVIATASARNHDYLRALGADDVIDYRSVRFEDVVRDVDIVVDTVGGDTLARSPDVLRDGGRLVTLVGQAPAAVCTQGRIVCPATPPWDVQAGLNGVAPLIAAGQLRVHVDGLYPLAQIVQAQQHNRAGSTRGKVVVAIAADNVASASGDDVAAVRLPLQAYLDGHATGQRRHFQRAFADDAVLLGFKDGRYRRWPARDYIDASSSGRVPADEAKRTRHVRQITVTGDVATAVIELDYPDMKALDHMTLLRQGDAWKIVVKAYHAWTPGTAEGAAAVR